MTLSTSDLINLRLPNDVKEIPHKYERTLTASLIVNDNTNMVKTFYQLSCMVNNCLRPWWLYDNADQYSKIYSRLKRYNEIKENEIRWLMVIIAGVFSDTMLGKMDDIKNIVYNSLSENVVNELLNGEFKSQHIPATGLRFDKLTLEQASTMQGFETLKSTYREQMKEMYELWKEIVTERVSSIRSFLETLFRGYSIEEDKNNWFRNLPQICESFDEGLTRVMTKFENKFEELKNGKSQPIVNALEIAHDAIIASCSNRKFVTMLNEKDYFVNQRPLDAVKGINVYKCIMYQTPFEDYEKDLFSIEEVRERAQGIMEDMIGYDLAYGIHRCVCKYNDRGMEYILDIYAIEGIARGFITNFVKSICESIAVSEASIRTVVTVKRLMVINFFIAVVGYCCYGHVNSTFEKFLTPRIKQMINNDNSMDYNNMQSGLEEWLNNVMYVIEREPEPFIPGMYDIQLIVFIRAKNENVKPLKQSVSAFLKQCLSSANQILNITRSRVITCNEELTRSVIRNIILQRSDSCFVTFNDSGDISTSLFGTTRLIEHYVTGFNGGWDCNIKRDIAGFASSPICKILGCYGYIVVRPVWICNSYGFSPWFEDSFGVCANRIMAMDPRFERAKITMQSDLLLLMHVKQFGNGYMILSNKNTLGKREDDMYSVWSEYWSKDVLDGSRGVEGNMINGIKNDIKYHIDYIVNCEETGQRTRGRDNIRGNYYEDYSEKFHSFVSVRSNRVSKVVESDYEIKENERAMEIFAFNRGIVNERFYGGVEIDEKTKNIIKCILKVIGILLVVAIVATIGYFISKTVKNKTTVYQNAV